MTESCPITPDQVDDRSTRIGAGLVLLLVVASLWLGSFWLPLALSLDFALRSRGRIAFSPIAQASKGLRQAFRLRPSLINAGPKRFAALVGAVFSLVIATALALHLPRVAQSAAAILLLCAALEAFLGFCVGCKVYSLLQPLSPGPKRPAQADPLEHP
jgi:hypothetical protein